MSFTNTTPTPDKVYYDLTVTNLDTISKYPSALTFFETRTIPFIYNPQEYFMSIIRFTIDTPTLPIFIPTVQITPDPNLTIYSITLEYIDPDTQVSYTSFSYVEYEPQNKYIDQPLGPSNLPLNQQDLSTDYYYIYNYQYWIYLVNKTLTQAYNLLKTKVEDAGLTLPSDYAPVLNWDSQNKIAILNCDVLGYSQLNPNHINIYMNPAMYQLFSSFPVYNEGYTNISDGKNFQIQTDTFGDANIIQYPPFNPVFDAIQVFQEYSTISLWTPITSIVFTSNMLPINATQISTPYIFIDGQPYVTGNNSNIQNIITDIVADDGLYKPSLYYNPTAQYRLISLTGNTPLINIDLQVYWKNRTGQLIPFVLSSGSTCTMKILFTKKGSKNYKEQ